MAVEFMSLDVRILSHPKMVRALAKKRGDALWLWIGLLSWTHQHDGDELPSDCIDAVEGPRGQRTRLALMSCLVSVGLVDESPSGWRPHDFDQWDSDAGSYLLRREERKRKKQQRKARESRTCPGQSQDSVQDNLRAANAHVQDLARAPKNRIEENRIEKKKKTREDPPTPPSGKMEELPPTKLDTSGRPIPRRPLFPAMVTREEYEPSPGMLNWSDSLGLGTVERLAVLRDLRDKHGLRPHTLEWWDERWLRFVEAVGSGPGHARPGTIGSDGGPGPSPEEVWGVK